MDSPVPIDLFAEDHAHEAFLVPMLERTAQEWGRDIEVRVRSARGGHGRAISELKLFAGLFGKPLVARDAEILVVGIDGNCKSFTKAREAIRSEVDGPLLDLIVMACPDPHIERWYMADPVSFQKIVGIRPKLTRKKCARDHYKQHLSKLVATAGHPPTLGGIEFARDLVFAMDLYQAVRNDHSLRAFLSDWKARISPSAAPTSNV